MAKMYAFLNNKFHLFLYLFPISLRLVSRSNMIIDSISLVSIFSLIVVFSGTYIKLSILIFSNSDFFLFSFKQNILSLGLDL